MRALSRAAWPPARCAAAGGDASELRETEVCTFSTAPNSRPRVCDSKRRHGDGRRNERLESAMAPSTFCRRAPRRGQRLAPSRSVTSERRLFRNSTRLRGGGHWPAGCGFVVHRSTEPYDHLPLTAGSASISSMGSGEKLRRHMVPASSFSARQITVDEPDAAAARAGHGRRCLRAMHADRSLRRRSIRIAIWVSSRGLFHTMSRMCVARPQMVHERGALRRRVREPGVAFANDRRSGHIRGQQPEWERAPWGATLRCSPQR
jgi:hypothetical protein